MYIESGCGHGPGSFHDVPHVVGQSSSFWC